MTQPAFGHDLSCLTGLTPVMAECDGFTTLAQALVRRLQTPHGTLIGDPNYGFQLIGEIDDDVDPADVARIGTMIDAEFQKDERVIVSYTSAVFSAGALTTTSRITTAAGPFSLTLGIGQIIAILASTPTVVATATGLTIASPSVATGGGSAGPPGPQGVAGPQGPSGTPGGTLAILVNYGPTAGTYSSSTSIPANARIFSVRQINGSPPLNGAGTTAIGQSGTPSLLISAGTWDPTVAPPAGSYEADYVLSWGAAPLPVLVTVGGAPNAGSGIVLVIYGAVLP